MLAFHHDDFVRPESALDNCGVFPFGPCLDEAFFHNGTGFHDKDVGAAFLDDDGLARHCNRVFTRDQLLDKVWGFDYLGDSRTVDVHIKRLREKLEGVSDKWELKTVWSVGYKFETKD